MDIIQKQALSDEEVLQYIDEYVLPNYELNGFLTLSAVGDFVLISRFQRAIKQLEQDESQVPNLAVWLFNVN